MSNSNNWPAWLPLREPLKPMSPYGAPQVMASAQLNTNENPFAPSSALVMAITKRVAEVSATLNRYPDRDAIALRAGLAKYITAQTGVTFDLSNLWAANGSNEIIQSIFLAFGRESALGFTPSYSMHPLIAKVTSVAWLDGKRRDDHSLDVTAAVQQVLTTKPTLTFITTPNNPTGSVVKISEIAELAKATAAVGGLLVVDEAYAEFSSEAEPIADPVIQPLDADSFSIRSKAMTDETKGKLIAEMETRFSSKVTVLNFTSVSPSIGAEVTRAAGFAILLAAVAILLYIWWAFRGVEHPYRYGAAAILAMHFTLDGSEIAQNLARVFGEGVVIETMGEIGDRAAFIAGYDIEQIRDARRETVDA